MNRLEATVVDGRAGTVEHAGVTFPIDAARGRTRGARVLVLVRPETVELALANGDGPGNRLIGEVITHTFLGSVTRLRVFGGESQLIADVSTANAAALPVGTRVVAVLPAEGSCLLDLPDGELAGEPSPRHQPS
jgi:hypothetical protein